MDVFILNKDINVIGIADKYDSMLWTIKHYEPGNFKVVFAFTDYLNSRLQLGNMIYKADEDEPGIITRKYLKLDKKGEQTIVVQGYTASRYLHQRIVWNKTILSGTPEMAMRRLVYEQLIEPQDPARRIPGIALGALMGYEGNLQKQVTYDNLQESLTAIGRTSGLGYKLRLDIAQRRFYFDVVQGVDRTAGSSHPCIFSKEFQNVYTQDYSEDISNYENICLIGGAGEDVERILSIVGEATGVERYEMFYNASGLLDTDIAVDEYIAQLSQKGTEKLSSYERAESFEIKINQNKAMPYNLGDYVTCTDNEWKITLDAQVTAIEKGYSNAGESVVITLGNTVPTLVDLIKAKE